MEDHVIAMKGIQVKRKNAKARDALSKKRQALWLKLKTMEQRERDMCAAICAP
jgi:hypothetical protein